MSFGAALKRIAADPDHPARQPEPTIAVTLVRTASYSFARAYILRAADGSCRMLGIPPADEHSPYPIGTVPLAAWRSAPTAKA